MKTPRHKSETARSTKRRWTKTRAIVLLRLTLVIATSYLLLAQGALFQFKSVTLWLIVAALVSNVPFFWFPRALIESTKFGAFLVVVDTLWITAVLLQSGYLGVDFYIFYFFVLFLAAVSENLTLMALGTVLVSLAYLYSVFATQGATVAWNSPTLIRLPFFFALAALYGFLSDQVRREREASRQLLYLAGTDPLTKLPNRRTFEESLERGIASASRTRRPLAVLLFDLDEFKYVNDTHGHAIGDQLLTATANRLQSGVRSSDGLGRFRGGEFDTASRLGGDEFAVVLTDVQDLDCISKVAERLRALISEPVQLENLEVVTSASAGVTVLEGEALATAADAETIVSIRKALLRQADRALYRAKEEGRDTVRFHDLEMDRKIRMHRTARQDLMHVLDRDELFLEFQPQVDLGSGSIIGAEALLRWEHPTRGLIPPSEFIPVAESTGRIREIGEWILRTACRAASEWHRVHPPGVPVAVNLSAVQFRDPELPEIVSRTLEEEGLSPFQLELELTESVFLRATPEVEESLRKLHDEVGVAVSLDDFGRGFSSLEYLLRYPIDKLKVDQLFVSSIAESRDSRAMVRAIIALAKSLRLGLVAEGVETESQLEFLQAERCERAQGYYFSRPVSSPALIELLVNGDGLIRPLPPTLLPAAGQST